MPQMRGRAASMLGIMAYPHYHARVLLLTSRAMKESHDANSYENPLPPLFGVSGYPLFRRLLPSKSLAQLWLFGISDRASDPSDPDELACDIAFANLPSALSTMHGLMHASRWNSVGPGSKCYQSHHSTLGSCPQAHTSMFGCRIRPVPQGRQVYGTPDLTILHDARPRRYNIQQDGSKSWDEALGLVICDMLDARVGAGGGRKLWVV